MKDFELTNDQKAASVKLDRFLESEAPVFSITGSAGVGKTHLLSEIPSKLEYGDMIGCGPTHKSVAEMVKRLPDNECMTIHRFLGLRPKRSKDKTFLVRRNDYDPTAFFNVRMVGVDECFLPETQLLTDRGFVGIADLNPSDLVANVNLATRLTTFEKPLGYIKRLYKGQIQNFYVDRLVSYRVTENHDLVVFNAEGLLIKKRHKDLKAADRFLLAAPSGELGSPCLTAQQRLALAFQADGSFKNYHKAQGYSGKYLGFPPTETTISFSFVRGRQIERLKGILDELGLEYSFWNNKVGKTIFKVSHVPCKYVSKNLKDVFTNFKVSSDFAKDFIDELVAWDGHVSKNHTGLYYSSTVRDNVDVAQTMCTLAGYKTTARVQVDSRKETYKDVYRLFISQRVITGAISSLRKSPSLIDQIDEYEGYVYCVQMPKGSVVIRHNDTVSISGNCSMVSTEIKNFILEDIKVWDRKYIALGDPYQLNPVDEINSPLLEMDFGENQYELKQIVRQAADSPIIKAATHIRDSILAGRAPDILEGKTDTSSVQILHRAEWFKTLEKYVENHVPDSFRAIAWRNDTVREFNQAIRGMRGEDISLPFSPGEFVVINEAYSIDDTIIFNTGMEFEVVDMTDYEYPAFPELRGWTVQLKADEVIMPETVNVLDSANCGQAYKQKLANLAQHANGNGDWRPYYRLQENWCDLRLLHALTAHKSQGSTFDNVFLDYRDIYCNRILLEADRCLYVALTRARYNVFVLL